MDLFNKSIVKTNFYNPKKAATSFRLDPNVFLKYNLFYNNKIYYLIINDIKYY